MVSLDGGVIKPYQMKREVKQGFPLAPYLFILMGEIFNFMVKDAMRVGEIERISLSESTNNISICEWYCHFYQMGKKEYEKCGQVVGQLLA